MAKAGPSTRFRAVTLTILAAGGVFLLVILLAAESFGLRPTVANQDRVDPATENDPALLATYGASGVLPQATELSPAVLAAIVSQEADAQAAAGIPEGKLRIPPVALDAYQRAEEALALQQPDCQVGWTLLAGLARVLSDHAGGDLDADGSTVGPILGPRLNGSVGLARIVDTDQGQLDGDPEWDRAVGPMQIIPPVWSRVRADSDADGIASPHNVYDAALAAGRYLCEDGAELHEVTEQAYAIFRYQRSDVFARAVMAWAGAYATRLAEHAEPESELPAVDEVPSQADTPTTQPLLPRGEPRAPAVAPRPAPAQPGLEPAPAPPAPAPPAPAPPAPAPPAPAPPAPAPPAPAPPATTPPPTPPTTPPPTTPPPTTPPTSALTTTPSASDPDDPAG